MDVSVLCVCVCVIYPLNSFLKVTPCLRLELLQVLWDSSCEDSLLFSFYNDSSSTVINDPAWTVTVRSLYQRIVREWIIKSLSSAPCTSQGLLQVDALFHCFNI